MTLIHRVPDEGGWTVNFPGAENVRACRQDGNTVEFRTTVPSDTPGELESFRHGRILQYVLRKLVV